MIMMIMAMHDADAGDDDYDDNDVYDGLFRF